MTWSRFEPGFTRHPKRVKCGPVASWLWVCSVDHCTEYRTDGFLDAASVKALVPGLTAALLAKAIEALIVVGSWEAAPDGYRVHGYLEHNMSADQVEASREANRRRYHRWRNGANAGSDPTANAVSNAISNARTNAVSNGVVVPLLLGNQSVSQSLKESKKSTTLSGSSPDDARAILDFLNHKASRNYQPSRVNLDLIRARLQEGATVDQCRAIIGRKAAVWRGDDKMAPYLRPATLFNRTKFAQYLGELPATAFEVRPDV